MSGIGRSGGRNEALAGEILHREDYEVVLLRQHSLSLFGILLGYAINFNSSPQGVHECQQIKQKSISSAECVYQVCERKNIHFSVNLPDCLDASPLL